MEKIGEAGKPKAALAPSIKDEEKSNEMENAVKSNELKKAVSEQENELRAKNEVAAKLETNTMPSNPDVEECKIESEEKIEEAKKPKAALPPPVQDDEKSKELNMDVSEQENELRAKIEVAVEEKDKNAGIKMAEITPSVQDDEKMRWKRKLLKQGNQQQDHQKHLKGIMTRILMNL